MNMSEDIECEYECKYECDSGYEYDMSVIIRVR